MVSWLFYGGDMMVSALSWMSVFQQTTHIQELNQHTTPSHYRLHSDFCTYQINWIPQIIANLIGCQHSYFYT